MSVPVRNLTIIVWTMLGGILVFDVAERAITGTAILHVGIIWVLGGSFAIARFRERASDSQGRDDPGASDD